jgi:LacI family transcriptional regulator
MLRALDDSGPYVVIKRRLATGRASSVFSDDISGAAAVTRHLIDQGHRRIALILGPAEIGVWEDRRSGFLNTLAQLGPDAQPGIVRQVGYPMDEAGREVTLEMLRGPDPPTAVFAGNDYIAVGVYRAIRDLGGEPGRDLAVAGYGANPFATMMHPSLTTLGTSGQSFGSEATNLLLDIVEGKVQSPAQRELPWHLEIRQSSARPLSSPGSWGLSNEEATPSREWAS